MRTWALLVAGLLAAGLAESAPRSENLVVSERSPELTLRIDQAFVPLPPLKFPIENLTDAERRIFVDAGADRVVDRLVIV